MSILREFNGASAAIAVALALSIAAPARAMTACDRAGVAVVGDIEEEQEACVAVEEVLGHFAAAGLPIDLRLKIRFQRTVFIEAAGPGDLVPVSGFYAAEKREVRVLTTDAARARSRKPWRLSWNRALHYSILRHEIAHAAVYQLLGEAYGKLPRAWHEALAYMVQLDLMDPSLRDQVLAQYPQREAFTSTLHINDFVYGADPDAFAVSAYKTYLREGRADFIRRALRFEVEMIDMSQLP